MNDQDNKLINQCIQTKKAAKQLAIASTDIKNNILISMARLIGENQTQILAANQKDLDKGKASQLSSAMLDRLRITAESIQQMQQALKDVIRLDDPLSDEYLKSDNSTLVRPNGIQVSKKRIPLGVILMIYESRPNVTVEAASLAVKSGNAIILRGGKEAFESNQIIADCWRKALKENNFNETGVRVLETTDRQILDQLLKLDEWIDLVIPRGGEGLIKHVVANSYIPVIKHYKGVCHLFVDESADFDMAINLLLNGKTQRPGVCNALEGLLVHKKIASQFLPLAEQALKNKKVTIYACDETRKILSSAELASEKEFMAEFLDLKISCKLVESLSEAIQYIDRYGSGHTEVIVTQDKQNAQDFINQVDASVVMVNASSRFSDGGELGLGAEIGISTSKIHAYGPMGLESLTSEKYVVMGEGQIR